MKPLCAITGSVIIWLEVTKTDQVPNNDQYNARCVGVRLLLINFSLSQSYYIKWLPLYNYTILVLSEFKRSFFLFSQKLGFIKCGVRRSKINFVNLNFEEVFWGWVRFVLCHDRHPELWPRLFVQAENNLESQIKDI